MDNMIRLVQLAAQMGAVKLERSGMKRRGPALTPQLKKIYGLKRSATHDDVLAKMQAERVELEKSAGIVR